MRRASLPVPRAPASSSGDDAHGVVRTVPLRGAHPLRGLSFNVASPECLERRLSLMPPCRVSDSATQTTLNTWSCCLARSIT